MKKVLSFIILFIICFSIPKNIYAIENPLFSPNNKYGIHILDDNDLEDASRLVNSSEGDWGYVTLVIRKDERDIKRWQNTFDKMRRLHLIPIVRIASIQEGNGWEKLKEEDVSNWVYFLNSLNWVVKNRYVIIGNEVNHSEEWGGELNPGEYSSILCTFYKHLKSASNDFFLIHAGLDASSPNDKNHMDEEKYIKEELLYNDIFNCFDGWSSHSYPNPNFSGSVYSTGRATVKNYIWEENLIKQLGYKKDLFIFITETGWVNNNLGNNNPTIKNNLTNEKISSNYKIAFEKVWTENNIVAVTPFVLNYQDYPFNKFSWKGSGGSYLPVYEEIKNIKKIKGSPVQIMNGEVKFAFIPKLSRSGTMISGAVIIKNIGQSIWDTNNTYLIIDIENGDSYMSSIGNLLEPGKTDVTSIRINIPEYANTLRGKIYLKSNNIKVSNFYNFEILTIRPISKEENLFSYIKNIIQAWVIKKPISE